MTGPESQPPPGSQLAQLREQLAAVPPGDLDQQLALLTGALGQRWQIWAVPVHPCGVHWNARPIGAREPAIAVTSADDLVHEVERLETWPLTDRSVTDLPTRELLCAQTALVTAYRRAVPWSGTRCAIFAQREEIQKELYGREAAQYERTYPGSAEQIGHVRHDVIKQLAGNPVADDAALILSELATNAVLHSNSRGGSFTIRMTLYGDYLHLECQDAGGPWRGRHRGNDDRPHGLDLVEALADSWDVQVTGDGSRIVRAGFTFAPVCVS